MQTTMNSATHPQTPTTLAATGTKDDGLDIPDMLKVQNRKPLTADQQKRLAEVQAAAHVSAGADLDKPKGTSDEDWQKHKAERAAEKKAKTDDRIAKLRLSKGLPLVKRKDQLPLPPNKNAKGVSVTAPAPKKPAGAKAKPAAAPTKDAPKKKAGDRARYDWNTAREKAAKGTVPAAPDFTAETHRYYRPILAAVVKLVKAGDLKGLQAYRVKGSSSSPRAVQNYREVAIIALKAKAA